MFPAYTNAINMIKLIALAVTCLALTFALEASAEKKVALIVGNSSYKVGPLKNPSHDARLMGKTLAEIGFDLIGDEVQIDLTREQLAQRIIEFGDHLRATKGVGVFYFAGHGVQVHGKNYLIPIGAKMDRAEYVEVFGVPIDQVLQQMESAENKLNLMILDACRNNPFLSQTRSMSRGVKINSAPSGTLILYATRPGMVSLDGEGENSPFTRSLTENMKKPGLKIEEVMRSTIKQVERETQKRQTPWQEGFVRDEFYFVKPELSTNKCPKGTTYSDGECVISRIVCPAGTREENGQCVADVVCPIGTEYVSGKGCTSVTSSQLAVASPSPSQFTTQTYQARSERPGLISSVPAWSYAALAIGIAAHAVNFVASTNALVKPTYLTALSGYTLAGVGLGVGVYHSLSASPTTPQTVNTARAQRVLGQGSISPQVSLSFDF